MHQERQQSAKLNTEFVLDPLSPLGWGEVRTDKDSLSLPAMRKAPKGNMRIAAKCYSGLNPAPFNNSALSAT